MSVRPFVRPPHYIALHWNLRYIHNEKNPFKFTQTVFIHKHYTSKLLKYWDREACANSVAADQNVASDLFATTEAVFRHIRK